MTRLYLVRHGEVATNQTVYGQLDVPLSPRGEEQLQRVAEVLAPIQLAAVYASDLQRAAHGARLIAESHGLEPCLDAAFREMNLGTLEGLTWEQIHKNHPELPGKRYRDMWSFRFPGGENLQDVAARVMPALQQALLAHEGGSLALVAHNSVNRIILGHALSFTPEVVFAFAQDFGCLNWIEYGEHPRVGLVNWTPDAPA